MRRQSNKNVRAAAVESIKVENRHTKETVGVIREAHDRQNEVLGTIGQHLLKKSSKAGHRQTSHLDNIHI